MKIFDIKELPQRFLNREQFEKIKTRYSSLPQGKYEINNNSLICNSNNGDINLIDMTYFHPSIHDILINIINDFQMMAQHIENADLENDYIQAKLKKIENM